MAESRRRLSPDDRRSELLALVAEGFGQRPYDDVRIDEIAERAGVSRALMYHYFPDKRAFFAAVVRAEGERLFEATNAAPDPEASMFNQVREGVLAYLRYDEQHPHGAWAAYIGVGASDPILRGIEDVDNDRQANRIVPPSPEAMGGEVHSRGERDLGGPISGWLAFAFGVGGRPVIAPATAAGCAADAGPHPRLAPSGGVPGVPAELADAVATGHR